MRLYVICRHCNQKIYFNSPAKSRRELPAFFQLKCPNVTCQQTNLYNSFEVYAEPALTATSGAVLGGLLGLLLGPEGAVGGAILGGAIGKAKEQEEKEAVERFNRGEG